MSRAGLAVLVLLSILLAAVVPARADSDDKKQQVQQIADRIEQLGDQAASLGQSINGAQLALQQADADVAASEQRLSELDATLGSVRASAAGFAVRSYVYADQMSGVSALVAGSSIADGSVQREGYSNIALGGTLSVADDLGALVEDAERERQTLADRKAARANAVKSLEANQQAAETALAKQRELLTKTKGELATLLAQERQQRAEAAARASQAAAAAAIARETKARESAPAAAPGSDNGDSARPRTAAPAAPAPATSSGAATAVRAALSQLGVPYRFATSQPGVSFDCSGLTMWAWAQAGVSMGHYTVTQYNQFPHVPLDQLQPGDLVFFYSDLGHNGMYIGNGQFVHAPRTGDVVKVSTLSGRNLVGAVRPG
jgi:cell wall-associated NlpC family hydrolase